ncbi:MAG: argininosuccinate lyase [Thermaerobacterales bacterium]
MSDTGDKQPAPWSGRFRRATDELVQRFTASVHVDGRLAREDMLGSIAHARMLGRQGIIAGEDARLIESGLKALLQDWDAGRLELDPALEDVHMNIETLLTERIGAAGKRLHTGRSRNDQVALDFRMYVKRRIKEIRLALRDTVRVLVDMAEEHVDTIMPGYTHLQRAQPVTLGHHLLAYAEMLLRDDSRFSDAGRRTDVMPLGSAALAGTSFPLDRESVAAELHFSAIAPNSMDAVADRDFAVEFTSAAAILSMHLSRLAEELVLWSTSEFNFLELDDAFATGSSIMPQKKNPDVAELVRGKTGRVYGDLVALLTILKGLPMTYNRDLQEDKEPLIDAADTVEACLTVLAPLLRTSRFNRPVLKAALGPTITATELADYLVRKGVPFREAHEVVGRMVLYCEAEGCGLADLTLEDLRRHSDGFEEDALQAADPAGAIEAREHPGGPGRRSVLARAAALRNWLAAPLAEG